MTSHDISTLTLPQLKTLQADVAKLIDKRGADDIAHARAQIAEIAKNAGIPLKDLLGKAEKIVTKAPIKYRDPANPDNTWSGRGRLPNWALKMKEAGTLEDARVAISN